MLEQTAAQMREAVAELAVQLRPFPAFMGMTSLQAIELEPPPDSKGRWGCVVVLPDGEICELELEVIPGPVGPTDVDQVDRYRSLELSAEDYIHFAAAARCGDGTGVGAAGGKLSLPAYCGYQTLFYWINR